MKPSIRSRALLGAAALGGTLVMAMSSAASAVEYSSSGANNSDTVTVSSNTVTPGTTIQVDIASSSSPGQPGPCAAGVPVTINLVLLQDGSGPQNLGSGSSNTNGGLGTTSVTIPASAQSGTYVVYAQCAGPDGSTQIITSPEVIVSPNGSHTAVAANHFTVSPSAGTPAQQQAINKAVQAQVAAGPNSPNGGLNLSIPRLTSAPRHSPSSSSSALVYGLIAGVAVLVAVGLVLLRSRRTAPTA